MPKIIDMKLPVEYFEKDRNNKLEARIAKFDLKKGDIIRFREWDSKKKQFTGKFFDKNVKDFHKIKKATHFWKKKDLTEFGLYILELENTK
jgi:hypothetical protein